MSHTPGPWFRDTASGFSCDVRAKAPNEKTQGRKIASCFLTMSLSEQYKRECDANAFLIAAAPDMLEALHFTRGLLANLEMDLIGTDAAPILKQVRISIIDTAIKKAEGIPQE